MGDLGKAISRVFDKVCILIFCSFCKSKINNRSPGHVTMELPFYKLRVFFHSIRKMMTSFVSALLILILAKAIFHLKLLTVSNVVTSMFTFTQHQLIFSPWMEKVKVHFYSNVPSCVNNNIIKLPYRKFINVLNFFFYL